MDRSDESCQQIRSKTTESFRTADQTQVTGASETPMKRDVASQPDSERLLPSGEEAGTAPEDRALRPDVEGLRAVAVLLVVLFHAGVPGMAGGFVGVDVFFVISGFVITGLLLRERSATGSTRFLAFYARRARRILPAAIFVILISLIASYLLIGPGYATLVASDARWSASFLGDYHFIHVYPNYLVARPNSPLQQYWSLAVEEQFYLVYPAFFVALLAAPGRMSVRARLITGLTAVIIVSLLVSVATTKVGFLGANYSPFTRAWELALGALVAVCTSRLEAIPKGVAAAITWIGLFGIVLSARTLSVHSLYPGAVVALPALSAALVIAGGAAIPRMGAESLLHLLPFRWVGRWSYSWYLWNSAALAIGAALLNKQVNGTPIAIKLLLVGVALVLAAATYFFVEQPFRHSKALMRSPGASVIGALLLIGTCVAFTYAF